MACTVPKESERDAWVISRQRCRVLGCRLSRRPYFLLSMAFFGRAFVAGAFLDEVFVAAVFLGAGFPVAWVFAATFFNGASFGGRIVPSRPSRHR